MLSLVLLLLSNNVHANDGGARNRFRVHEQPLNRRRAGKTEHVKAHHGGGRGHHRDPIEPGAGKSGKVPSETTLAAVAPVAVVVSESVISLPGSGKAGKEVLASAETPPPPSPMEVASTTAVDVAVVSESVAVSSGGKSGKMYAPAHDARQSPGEEVVAPTGMSPSDATVENATDEGMITMMTKQTPPDTNSMNSNTTVMSSNIVLSGGLVAKSGKSAGGGGNVIITESNATGVSYPAIDVGGSGAKSGKLAGGEGNVTSYGSKVSKTYTGEPDADIVKPKASKVNQPLTEFFIKEPTPPAKPKSGKSAGGSVTGGKSGKYATGGKTSKTDALTSMSYDYDVDGGGMSGTTYDLLKADPNFSTFVGAVNAAGIPAILELPGLTVAGVLNCCKHCVSILCFIQFLPPGLHY
jgi:hypothetical protein